MTTAFKSKTPNLRFKEFSEDWKVRKISDLFKKSSNPVKVDIEETYQEIGIRSHGKGIFYKEPIKGKELGNKRVFWLEPNVFIVNIVFAWERAIDVTSEREKGLIASHRFPMYKAIEDKANVYYIRHFFLTKKGQYLLELASPGGAGRNKTLGQSTFAKLKLKIPDINEQNKINNFLTLTDEKIDQIRYKHELLSQYKKGIVQRIFSQEIRFKKDDGSEFDDWEPSILQNLNGFSIKSGNSKNKKDIGEHPYYGSTGLIGFSDVFDNSDDAILIARVGANAGSLYKVSGKYAVSDNALILSISKEFNLNFLFEYLEEYNLRRLVFGTGQPLVTGGMIKKINIFYPSLAEQEKIAAFVAAIDEKIDQAAEQLELARKWKEGLLQQIFL